MVLSVSLAFHADYGILLEGQLKIPAHLFEGELYWLPVQVFRLAIVWRRLQSGFIFVAVITRPVIFEGPPGLAVVKDFDLAGPLSEVLDESETYLVLCLLVVMQEPIHVVDVSRL